MRGDLSRVRRAPGLFIARSPITGFLSIKPSQPSPRKEGRSKRLVRQRDWKPVSPKAQGRDPLRDPLFCFELLDLPHASDDTLRRISRAVCSWHIPSPSVSTAAVVSAGQVKVPTAAGGRLDHKCVAIPHHHLNGELISKQTEDPAPMAGQVGWPTEKLLNTGQQSMRASSLVPIY